MVSGLGDPRIFIFLLLAFGFAVCDLWVFHALDKQTDILILFTTLGGAGVSVAHTAGVNAVLSVPPNTKPGP